MSDAIDDIMPWDDEEIANRHEVLGEGCPPIDYGESDFDIGPDMGDH
jgi:hypothetical protein